MTKIINGRIYDPINGKNGVIEDIYYENGRMVEGGSADCDVLDASGCVVMAGGVNVHSHLAGEPLEVLRDAGNPLIPPTWDTGRQYCEMGYTTVVNAATPVGAIFGLNPMGVTAWLTSITLPLIIPVIFECKKLIKPFISK